MHEDRTEETASMNRIAVKNMLERGFNAMGPERKWVTDVTEIKPMKASKYFLAFNALR